MRELVWDITGYAKGIVFMAVIFWGATACAEDGGRTGADFLNIGIDTRSAALGGTGTAYAANSSASYWNPAGLTSVRSAQVLFSHFVMFQDISFDYLGGAIPLSSRCGVAAGISYLGYGSIEGYDASNNPTGQVNSTYDMAVAVSAAYQITDAVSAGITTKAVMVSLAGESGSAAAVDLGLRLTRGAFAFGASAVNLGNRLEINKSQADLPAAIRLGIAFDSEESPVMVATELHRPIHGSASIRMGAEYAFIRKYFLRVGYRADVNGDASSQPGFSLGAGAGMGPIHFDYSFAPGGDLITDDLHRFSLIFSF